MYVDDINTNVHLHTYFIVTNVFQIQKELEKRKTSDHKIRVVNIRTQTQQGKRQESGPTFGKHVIQVQMQV